MLETDLEGGRAQLAIERVRRELIGQLLGIQQGLLEGVRLLFGLVALRLSGGQKLLDNIGQRALTLRRLVIAAYTHAGHDLLRMLPGIIGLRAPDVELDVGPGCGGALIGLAVAVAVERLSIEPIVLGPYERVVRDVLADDCTRIQRGEVGHAHRGFEVEAGRRCQNDRALIGLVIRRLDAAGLRRHHDDGLAALVALLEDQGLDLDALATCKDVADGHGAGIRHRHGIVEHVQLLIELHHQIAVLNTVGGDDGAIGRGAPLQAEDVLGRDVVLDRGPLYGIGGGGRVIGVAGNHCDRLLRINAGDFHLIDDDVTGLVEKNKIAANNHVVGGLGLNGPVHRVRRIDPRQLAAHEVLAD